jgi:hypothetical protein
LVSVQPNERGSLDVRVAQGTLVPTHERVVAVRGGGSDWSAFGEVNGQNTKLGLPEGGWLFASVLDGAAYFTAAGQGQRCDLTTGRCAGVGKARPAPELIYPGPGEGFRLSLTADGDIRLALPHDAEGEGETILADVARIAGVRWLKERMSGSVQEYVDRTFRGRAALTAAPANILVDGLLEEWEALTPAVVDAPWQLDRRDGWNGPEDASFSVAVATSGADLCFAGRLRDDLLTNDDELVFNVGAERWRVPLLSPGAHTVVAEEWFGHRFEACFRAPESLAKRGTIPLGVALRDSDNDGSMAVLSTAPRLGPWSAGTLSLAP